MNEEQKKIFNSFPIYGMTAEKLSYSNDNIYDVTKMLEAGVKVIQYREKEYSHKYMYEQCIKIRELTKRYGALFLIDDFVDLSLIVGADGVHIGQDDLPIEKVRSLVPKDFIIGLSTHSEKQALNALSFADYIGVGPIYKTNTKKNVCDPVSLSYLSYVVKNIDLPFVAIGGIKDYNVKEVFLEGANLVCLVTGIVASKDICGEIKKIVSIYKEVQNH